MPDPQLAKLLDAARTLLPASCGLGVADPAIRPATASPAPWPGEDLHAVPARRAEFAAGRIAARAAMTEIGLPPVAIPMGPDRAPIWPTGLSGSISHSRTACLAAVISHPHLIGIDIEPDEDLPHDTWDTVLRPTERAALPDSDAGRIARQLFSAKEAAYKAQYQHSRQLIGFEALEIVIHPGGFTATFCHPVPGFATGTRLQGRIASTAGHVLTVVTCMRPTR